MCDLDHIDVALGEMQTALMHFPERVEFFLHLNCGNKKNSNLTRDHGLFRHLLVDKCIRMIYSFRPR